VLLAEELGAMGFFNGGFAPEEFRPLVGDYARTLAELSPEAVTATKRQLYEDLLGADPGAPWSAARC